MKLGNKIKQRHLSSPNFMTKKRNTNTIHIKLKNKNYEQKFQEKCEGSH